MSFFGAAVMFLLNTNVGDWSVFDWMMGFCAIVLLYGAGSPA